MFSEVLLSFFQRIWAPTLRPFAHGLHRSWGGVPVLWEGPLNSYCDPYSGAAVMAEST
jgi:hypothetical protein